MDPNQIAAQPIQTMQEVQSAPEKATGANKYLQPYKSRRAIILDNFLGGLFWSLGTFLGLAVLTLVVGYFISKIDLIPIIGSWIAKILEDATSRIQPPI
jgi:hypothetical protein